MEDEVKSINITKRKRELNISFVVLGMLFECTLVFCIGDIAMVGMDVTRHINTLGLMEIPGQ